VHRDLKPENVILKQCRGRRKVVRGMLNREQQPPTIETEASYDQVKLLDFGIAKMFDAELGRQTLRDVVLGTPQYMAPETARGKHEIDHRVDIYALGVIFYEMLTGCLPFEATTAIEMMLAHCTKPVPPPRLRNPRAEVTDAAEALIRRALAKEPNERHEDMDEFLAELSTCYGDENFLRNVERQVAIAPPTDEPRPRPRSLTEEL
jgi:serine/threonine-protein kinase